MHIVPFCTAGRGLLRAAGNCAGLVGLLLPGGMA